MKSIQWVAPRKFEVVEKAIPELKKNDVLLKVESVGICGSDIHYYLEGRIGDQVITPPLVLGHELSGRIVRVKDKENELLLGKRVAVEPGFPCWHCEFCKKGHYNVCPNLKFLGGPGCDGALMEYISVPGWACFPVPEDLSAPIASMVEPTAVAVHALELAQMVPGETALVVGLGSIGLIVLQLLLNSGASVVAGIDLLEYRTVVAQKLGLKNAFVPSNKESIEESVEWAKEVSSGRGFDVVFDCTNQSEGLAISTCSTKPAGRVVLVGISGKDYDLLPVSIARRRELTLKWCRRFLFNFPTAITLVSSGKISLDLILTHHFTPEEVETAFEMVANNSDNIIKASIDWD
ncbi:MAG: alcohol dehydrogenase catalytic domain-containing protein [Candidatus Hydrogenedentes bacterium]|nr:alcohol dehydrogenase catalytic domain-containing protein [Candidatus Hydrogenedentota bacterium]